MHRSTGGADGSLNDVERGEPMLEATYRHANDDHLGRIPHQKVRGQRQFCADGCRSGLVRAVTSPSPNLAEVEVAMKPARRSSLLVAGGFAAGCAVSFVGVAVSHEILADQAPKPSSHAYQLYVDEVSRPLIESVPFNGPIERVVHLSDGSEHRISLQPIQRNGVELVALNDTAGGVTTRSLMGRDAVARNGHLSVRVLDLHAVYADMCHLRNDLSSACVSEHERRALQSQVASAK